MPATKRDIEIFFHIGLGKTATTYLQYEFFPKLQGIYYIQRTLYRKYQEVIAKTGQSRYFVSREFDQQLETEVDKIAAAYPNAKIIIVLRRQDGWIASQYRRYVKNGGGLPFNKYFDVEHDTGLWKRSDVDFMAKIKYVEEKFGQPPLVLFHEDLRKNAYAFFDKLANFLGATYDRDAISLDAVHSSYSEKQLKVIKKFSFLFSQDREYSNVRFLRWLQRRSQLLASYLILYPAKIIPESWVSDEPLIPQAELDKVRDYYAEAWAQCKAYARAHNATAPG